ALRNRVRQYVLVGIRAAGQKAVFAQPNELRGCSHPAEHRVLLHDRVARKLRVVRNDDVIGKLAVVTEMRIRHEKISVAYPRAAALGRAEIDRDILRDAIAITDHELRVTFPVSMVLRRSAQNGGALDVIVFTDDNAAEAAADACVRLDDRAGADSDLALEHAVW